MCQRFMLKIMAVLLLILPWSWSICLSKTIGSFAYYFCSEKRSNVIKNLSVVYQKQDVRKQARKVFASFGQYLAEFLSPLKKKKKFIQSIRYEGLENLLKPSAQGKGVIAVTPHLGNWEMAALATVIQNVPVSAVFFSHPNPSLNQLFMNRRIIHGLEVIPWKQDSTHACLDALRRGRTVAIAGDIDFLGTGIDVELFGKKTKIPRGPVVFSRRAQAPIVPGAFIREGNSGCLFFDSAIYPEGKTENQLADDIAKALEKMIKRDPAQWICFEEIWEE